MTIDPIASLSVILAGLAAGSFLNVVVDRVPLHESIVAPASHCDVCATP